MSIVKKSFGQLPDGRKADLYIMTNSAGNSVEITNYGGIIRAINVPDKNGNIGNVVLGYNDVNGYVPLCGYLGALIGRVGNRIAKGECEIEGKKIVLAKNEKGKNHLHGGNLGFDRKFWDVIPVEGICEDSLIMKIISPDGEEGYPGTLKVQVTYTWTDENELVLRYEAVSDKDTLCNLTNHCYFNLEGEASGETVLDHTFEINADTFTVGDADLIPTGEQRDVTGTNFDFRNPTVLRDVIAKKEEDEQLKAGNGVDHNFNINDPEAGLRFASEVIAPKSGRVMNVFTDQYAMQLYVGCCLKGINPGSSGRVYQPYEGFCQETQLPPDAINHDNFPQAVLYAGEKYDYTTVFSFDVVEDEE
ncbi:MAG: galactose mutarotase [Oscillospiraceae bacterium]|nr:galactose mutarotase [Oscillospiraceae bacterium]